MSAATRSCGCGFPVTEYDGRWLHVLNPELTGSDDHDASPDDDTPEHSGAPR